MDSVISLIFNFITGRFSNLLSSSIVAIKTIIADSIRDFLRLSILSSIASQFFCLSVFIFCFELAYQYDKTQSISFSAVLVASIFLIVVSVGLLSYFFREQTKTVVAPSPQAETIQSEHLLENALAILINEFAKDKEFAREKARKDSNLNNESHVL